MPTIEFPAGMTPEQVLALTRKQRPELFGDGTPEPRPSEPDNMLTPAEVARMFRVDPKTVTRWAKAGRLPCIRTPGGHRRYPEREVLAMMNESRQYRAA
jgi:excisionase family DNA binding protein